MDENPAPVNENLLSRLVPMTGLSTPHLRELVEQAEVVELAAGDTIDTRSVATGCVVYVITGTIELLRDGSATGTVEGGSDQARYALSQLPGKHESARAKTTVKVLRLDRAKVSTMVLLSQSGSGDSDEGSEHPEDWWAVRLLRSELLSRIPPANLRRIFDLMSPRSYREGDTVIRQGETGDYYYVIEKGSCEVMHQAEAGIPALAVAELGVGDSFGEEALLTDAERNASVLMLADGTLRRLTKQDFVELIKDPLLDFVNLADAEQLVAQGAGWLDVRLAEEHRADGIEGSLNLPLREIRRGTEKLDTNRAYVVYCNSGRRSSAGAFLLKRVSQKPIRCSGSVEYRSIAANGCGKGR